MYYVYESVTGKLVATEAHYSAAWDKCRSLLGYKFGGVRVSHNCTTFEDVLGFARYSMKWEA